MYDPINVLNEIMRLLGDTESIVDALSQYSGCVDVDYNEQIIFGDGTVEVRSSDVYIVTPYIAIHCDPKRCLAMIDTTSYIIYKGGRIEIAHLLNQYYGIWRREDLERLFNTLERSRDALELAIKELESGVERLKSMLAEAKLLCS
jgi:hypothetical protein